MIQVKNYICGQWVAGTGEEQKIYNAITGDQIGSVSSEGLDYQAILDYGRTVGGKVLRKMTFQERGRMLKALAFYLLDRKRTYYEVSSWTGATKIDSWIDIEGGIGLGIALGLRFGEHVGKRASGVFHGGQDIIAGAV